MVVKKNSVDDFSFSLRAYYLMTAHTFSVQMGYCYWCGVVGVAMLRYTYTLHLCIDGTASGMAITTRNATNETQAQTVKQDIPPTSKGSANYGYPFLIQFD